MTMRIVGGPLIVRLVIDEEDHRLYTVRHRIESDDTGHSLDHDNPGYIAMNEGPDAVARAAGLPIKGDLWASNMEAGGSEWAYCLPNATIEKDPQLADQPSQLWTIEQQFTTRGIKRRINQDRGDPLLEDPRMSGGTVKFTEEAVYDRNAKRILTSSMELIRGPQNEWDMARSTYRVQQQVADLGQEQVEAMMNCVNDAELWGLPKRCLKLSDWSWEQLFVRYGSYFSRTLNFEGWVRKDRTTDPPKSGWDRDVLDEGTKCLRGRWQNFGTAEVPVWSWVLIGNPMPTDPRDFVRFTDINGNMARVPLDGAGKPYTVLAGPTVSTCTQCATAPQKWDVAGFPAWESALNGTLLEYQSGCTWQATKVSPFSGNVGIILQYSTSSSVWEVLAIGLKNLVTGAALPNQRWTKASADWQCNGANILTADSNNSSLSLSVTVSPAVANSPGSIHVEKYPEANFLELGIPAIMGQ